VREKIWIQIVTGDDSVAEEMRKNSREVDMKTKTMVAATAVAAGLFLTNMVAQQAGPPPDKADAGKMGGGMMSAGMMPQMHRMTMGQNDTDKLVDRIVNSFAAIEAEKDPAALKAKLAEHGSLLKELQAKVQSQSRGMDMMQRMMSGSMMGGEQKK